MWERRSARKHGGDFWVEHLLFRNYLRSHKEVAQRYENLKRKLIAALAPEPDRAAYSDGKTEFIVDVVEKARAGGRVTARIRSSSLSG